MNDAGPVTARRRRHTLADIYHERTHFDFIDRSWRWVALSGALVLISVLGFAFRGLNFGIEFEGGTQWQFTRAAGSASIDDVRDVLDPLGLADAKILIVGDDSVRVQSVDLPPGEQLRVTNALAGYAGAEVSVTTVGPTWGDKVSEKALQAVLVFFLVIALYLSFRLEWRMAVAALVAVLHDILITVGVYAVTGFEVTPATVVAFLTILGFSLYDTVVVFDKVKENQARLGTERGDTYSKMVNRSLNQVLVRSLNTSIVAVLPVASLLIVGSYVFGGLTLRDFALALFVGLLVGTYSSIFVATPLLAWMKEREPRYRALRARAQADLARQPVTAEVAVGGGRQPGRERAAADEHADPAMAVPVSGAPPGPPEPGEPIREPSMPRPVPSAARPAGSAAAVGGVQPRPRQHRRRKRR